MGSEKEIVIAVCTLCCAMDICRKTKEGRVFNSQSKTFLMLRVNVSVDSKVAWIQLESAVAGQPSCTRVLSSRHAAVVAVIVKVVPEAQARGHSFKAFSSILLWVWPK